MSEFQQQETWLSGAVSLLSGLTVLLHRRSFSALLSNKTERRQRDAPLFHLVAQWEENSPTEQRGEFLAWPPGGGPLDFVLMVPC